MFLLAAFAPFVILRLFPAVEAATVARGISRAPARATQTALLSALTVTRLAGVAQAAAPSAAGPAATPIAARRRRHDGTRARPAGRPTGPGAALPHPPRAARPPSDEAAGDDAAP